MIISELSVDYMSFDDDDKEISGIAISYKDNRGKEQRRWLEKPRRIGHWIYLGGGRAKCSVCKWVVKDCYDQDNEDLFCRKCGSKMGKSEDNTDE